MTSSAVATNPPERLTAPEVSTNPPQDFARYPASRETAQRSAPRSARLILGVALVALSALAYALTEGALKPGRVSLLALCLGGVALVTALYEAVCVLRQRARLENPLELFPAAGTALIALGALAEIVLFPNSAPALTASGPVLAAGVLLLVRALFNNRSELPEAGRGLLMPTVALSGHVQKGEKFSLSQDMIVRSDCKIESGCVSVLERYLSPETTFRVKEEGEVIFAGSEIVGGSANAVALSGGEDSCLRSLENLVAGGLSRAGVSLHKEDLKARRATAYILVFVAVASAILWDERSGDAWKTLAAAGLVLFSGAICQIADVLYAQQLQMVRRWARRGFVASSDAAVRELASATSAVLDQSRLGLGSLVRVRQLEILDDRVGTKELCSCLAALLGRADDVALMAAGSHCQEIVGHVSPDRVLDLKEVRGGGIRGSLKGVPVSVGTEEFLLEQGILIHPSESNVETADNEQPLLVAIGCELVGRFWLVFGQQHLVTEDASERMWRGLGSARISTGVQGEISENTLLVRGRESDVLGRSARLQVALFAGDRFELPRSTLVALTPNLLALPSIIEDCHRYLRAVERARILVAFGVFVSVAAVFLGLFTPLIPGALLAAIAGAVFLF